MELTFGPKGRLMIDDATIPFSNFAGKEGKYNKAGERDFAVLIPTQEMADALIDAGWNVVIKPPENPGDNAFMFMKVRVGFNDYGPDVYLKAGGNVRKLDERTVGLLDTIDIDRVDMDIRAHNWTYGGRSGRTAWLDKIHVVQRLDRFAAMYAADERGEGPLPF